MLLSVLVWLGPPCLTLYSISVTDKPISLYWSQLTANLFRMLQPDNQSLDLWQEVFVPSLSKHLHFGTNCLKLHETFDVTSNGSKDVLCNHVLEKLILPNSTWEEQHSSTQVSCWHSWIWKTLPCCCHDAIGEACVGVCLVMIVQTEPTITGSWTLSL